MCLMSPKSTLILAIAATVLLACPFAVPAMGAVQQGDYVSQLDVNGQGLYSYFDDTFEAYAEAPQDTIGLSMALTTGDALFDTVGDAKAYADMMVRDTLVSYYMTNPFPIWLWDLPLKDVAVDTVTDTCKIQSSDGIVIQKVSLVGVSFQLSVPDAYKDDPATEADETLDAINAVKGKMKTYEGNTQQKVQAIADDLRGIKVKTDEEGKISNIYDALVKNESSTAGIAAAFTWLADSNGLDAITVSGNVVALEGDPVTGYWNQVYDEGGWYAVDCTWTYKEDERNCLLVGASTSVVHGNVMIQFGAGRVVDLGDTTLVAPQIELEGVEWPDNRNIIDKYGAAIFTTIICLIIVLVIVRAVRSGEL